MYKVASDRRQSALHRGRPEDWMNGQERLSFADQLAALQDGIKVIEARILAASANERRELGLRKLAMQGEITAFRKKAQMERKVKDGLSQVFVSVAKEMLPKLQFDLIYRATEREYALAVKALDEERIAHTETAGQK